MILEGIAKQSNEYVGGKSYSFVTKMMMGYIFNKNFKVDLPLTKIDSISYLAKASGHEELLPLINTAAMDKDFDERNKAQKELKQKMGPCITWLKDNLYNILSNAEKPKVSQDPFGNYVVEYRSNEEHPYVKLVDNIEKKEWRVISFHDESMVLKKKSYNDTNSWKFGSKETRQAIRDRIK